MITGGTWLEIIIKTDFYRLAGRYTRPIIEKHSRNEIETHDRVAGALSQHYSTVEFIPRRFVPSIIVHLNSVQEFVPQNSEIGCSNYWCSSTNYGTIKWRVNTGGLVPRHRVRVIRLVMYSMSFVPIWYRCRSLWGAPRQWPLRGTKTKIFSHFYRFAKKPCKLVWYNFKKFIPKLHISYTEYRVLTRARLK